jgi:hypothetical protein
MNNKQKLLKRLAERHHLLGDSITRQQRTMLEGTKYAHLVDQDRVKSNFSLAVEQIASEPAKQHTRSRLGDPNVHRSTLRDLVDELEDKFGMCSASTSHTKFKSVDIERLKNFIREFSDREVYDASTQSYITSLLECDNIYSLMGKLYTVCGN